MQILPPLPARARRTLSAVPSLFDGSDRAAYQRAYVENFQRYALPYLGNSSLPAKGLRDSDLPKGVKWLDLGLIAAFINGNRTASQQALGTALKPQAGDDIARGEADSRRFSAWFLLRLGAYYPPLDLGHGGETDRYAMQVSPVGVLNYVRQFSSLSKDTLAQWVDNPPDWSPWKDWATNPNAILALAVIWAQKVIAQRYGYSIDLYDAAAAAGAGAEVAKRIEQDLIAAARDKCSSFANIIGPIISGIASIGGPWVSVPTGMLLSFSGRGICGAVADGKTDEVIARFRLIADVSEQTAFLRGVYAKTFGTSTMLSDGAVSVLFAKLDDAGVIDARDMAMFIAQPQNSDVYLPRELAARAGLIRTVIKPLFQQVVGCPVTDGYAHVLADKYVEQGWSVGNAGDKPLESEGAKQLRAFLTMPSAKTRALAMGSACARIGGTFRTEDGDIVSDGSKPVETVPSGAYVKLITGVDPAVHETVSNYGHTDDAPPAELPPVPPPAPKSSPLPFIIGAAVVAGLLFARRK